ncbi:uncharacterized protein LOC130798959 isoform X2 [Amaranthus tricolor]|uniref:uncharacterized protein LOC130798959 isoform X2 n=1 Tax=Amaranthus tricolor TaxID=29722 RepID=UPI00258542CE|nr:uncharacterized protein LOC130798959 isoform X2 [Amaranthus tricolor]
MPTPTILPPIQLWTAAVRFINLGRILSTTLIIWQLLIMVTGSKYPVVVVLTGSMEPGIRRGDILFLNTMKKSPIQPGEIVVFKIEGKDIPIVHRVIKIHMKHDSNEVNLLTKGDANLLDDSYGIYADDQLWLENHHIIGRVMGYVPFIGWATILMTEKPLFKLRDRDCLEMSVRRCLAVRLVTIGMILTSLMPAWKVITFVVGCDTPVIVVVDPSMTPGIVKGDILIIKRPRSPLECGDIIIFAIKKGGPLVVHRVVQVNFFRDTGKVYLLTKGDSNPEDDRIDLYKKDKDWIKQDELVVGKAIWYIPHIGWVLLFLDNHPTVKYLVIGAISIQLLKRTVLSGKHL